MNKWKIAFLSIASIMAVLFIGGIMFSIHSHKDCSTFAVIGCDASMYEQESGIGYLTVVYGDAGHKREIKIRVNDAALQSTLSEAELENVIGVSVECTIPYKKLKEQHIAVENFNLLEHLQNDAFDNYLVLLDVFYK